MKGLFFQSGKSEDPEQNPSDDKALVQHSPHPDALDNTNNLETDNKPTRPTTLRRQLSEKIEATKSKFENRRWNKF